MEREPLTPQDRRRIENWPKIEAAAHSAVREEKWEMRWSVFPSFEPVHTVGFIGNELVCRQWKRAYDDARLDAVPADQPVPQAVLIPTIGTRRLVVSDELKERLRVELASVRIPVLPLPTNMAMLDGITYEFCVLGSGPTVQFSWDELAAEWEPLSNWFDATNSLLMSMLANVTETIAPISQVE